MTCPKHLEDQVFLTCRSLGRPPPAGHGSQKIRERTWEHTRHKAMQLSLVCGRTGGSRASPREGRGGRGLPRLGGFRAPFLGLRAGDRGLLWGFVRLAGTNLRGGCVTAGQLVRGLPRLTGNLTYSGVLCAFLFPVSLISPHFLSSQISFSLVMVLPPPLP